MEDSERSKSDLRFFKIDVEFETEEVVTSIDCDSIIALQSIVDGKDYRLLIKTTGGDLFLPNSELNYCYNKSSFNNIYKALSERWINYKMNKTT